MSTNGCNPRSVIGLYLSGAKFMPSKTAIAAIRMRLQRSQPLIAAILLLTAAAWGQARSIDGAESKLLVHAFKSGLFSGFADNHEVQAPIVDGTIDEGVPRVKFVVDSRRMKVLDPQLSTDKRRQVQERMLGPDVLDSARFPTITFESTKVERVGSGQLLVGGRLSLHGVTRSISVTVRNERGRYVGSCTLKQRDFGIMPISIGGGTVKVKNELKIDFDIRTTPRAAGGSSSESQSER